MNIDDIADRWAQTFGLAIAPLFESDEIKGSDRHHVLLDGGYGSFAMSVGVEKMWKSSEPAEWCWSSNLPHHVTITDTEVGVVRWDKRKPELLTLTSVENQIDAFYSYLNADRIQSSKRVVEHMLNIFRRVRSLVADADLDDDLTVDAFLAVLIHALSGKTSFREVDSQAGRALLSVLSQPGIESIREDFSLTLLAGQRLSFFPELAVRHAGSVIFQEAHFELLRASSPDLFGFTQPAQSRQVTRGGAHFTPPALARSIAEKTFAQIDDLHSREKLVILDPACGAGAFLHEALRTLRRLRFSGSVVLVGRDISKPAMSMAKFVLEAARADWAPKGGCDIDLEIGDSLSLALPTADVVLMNPPFISWSALSADQREQMAAVLGHNLQGRADFSMAFVTRALNALKKNGVIGTLLPASLFNLQAADAWRRDLLDQADLRFIASLGDFGLFSYALVQVAALVLSKQQPFGRQDAIALVTDNSAEATGNALRALRRFESDSYSNDRSDPWRLFRLPVKKLREQSTWRLVAPHIEISLRDLLDSGRALPVGSLFDVRQGVRTGHNPSFLLTSDQLEQLPLRERKWFRAATTNDSIVNGQIRSRHWIFYPYDDDGLAIKTEQQLAKAVPSFLKKFLTPERETLSKRANIIRGNRPDWWGLSERRSWALSKEPRLISKYFGGPGGVATDLDCQYIVVQGFAWFPKWIEDDNFQDDVAGLPTRALLAAYAAIMNSKFFGKLLEVFSPHVAGGQFDLSPRYMNAVPLPNLPALIGRGFSRTLNRLAALGYDPKPSDVEWQLSVDRMVIDLYGGDIFELR